MQVQPAIGVDFATGVRNLLRQDPDIIMVGEIRDLETAEMAVQASLTGHLVLSTLHTNDAPSSVTRLLEIGTPAYQLRATLLGVVAQRLVRTLCTHCRVALKPEEVKWRGLRPPKGAEGGRYFTARGCDECRNTGYRGRIGLYEVLVLNSNLRSMIGDDLNLDHFRNGAQRQGMQTLRQSGALKVASGLTTVEEVMAVTPAGDLSL
jgi:general secretion pathway protein E